MYGRLSELGSIPSRRYNLAMSVALGQHMDAVVVDDRATAFKAVDWLKRTRCVCVCVLGVCVCVCWVCVLGVWCCYQRSTPARVCLPGAST